MLIFDGYLHEMQGVIRMLPSRGAVYLRRLLRPAELREL